MLCFLAPVIPPRRQPLPPRPHGSTAITVMLTLLAVSALFTPIGWMRTQPVYELRVGIASHLGPRAEETGLIAHLGHTRSSQISGQSKASSSVRPHAFFARNDAYDAVPPGMSVEPATGALVGVPSMPGTYTLAVGVSDGASRPVTGPTFQVRVLPAS